MDEADDDDEAIELGVHTSLNEGPIAFKWKSRDLRLPKSFQEAWRNN